MKKFEEYLSPLYKEETYDGDDFEAYGELCPNDDDIVDEAEYLAQS